MPGDWRDGAFEFDFGCAGEQSRDRAAVDAVTMFFVDLPTNSDVRTGRVLGDLRQRRHVRGAGERNFEQPLRWRLNELERRAIGLYVPQDVALRVHLAEVQPSHAAGVGDLPAVAIPGLVLVDVAEHDGGGLGVEQRARGKFVVKPGHRYAVFRDGLRYRAVTDHDARYAGSAGLQVVLGPCFQEC